MESDTVNSHERYDLCHKILTQMLVRQACHTTLEPVHTASRRLWVYSRRFRCFPVLSHAIHRKLRAIANVHHPRQFDRVADLAHRTMQRNPCAFFRSFHQFHWLSRIHPFAMKFKSHYDCSANIKVILKLNAYSIFA